VDPYYIRLKYNDLARSETESWARCAYKSEVAQDMKFKAAQALIDFSKIDFLLDAGCGDGRFINSILGGKVRAVGIDVSEEMIDIARHGTRIEDLNWFEACELENLDRSYAMMCRKKDFDCITCIGVIQCIKEEEPVLNEFYKVARFGAQLLIIGLDSRSVDPSKKPAGYDLYDRNPKELEYKLYKIGFRTIKSGGINLDGTLTTRQTRDFFILARKEF